MSISAKTVMELRKMTNVGMMECKKALISANGDLDSAKELLLHSGAAKAIKKVDRVVNEGKLFVATTPDNHSAVVVEINCETDFVAKSDMFEEFGTHVVAIALAKECHSPDHLLEQSYVENETVEQGRHVLIGKLGENIQIGRVTFIRQDSGTIVSYSHGHKIVTLVGVSTNDADVAKDIAMHIAAMRPIAISSAGIGSDLIEKEKAVFSAQLKDSGKDAAIVAKILDGKMNKFLDDVSLYGQVFVKDSKKKVAQYLKEHNTDVTQFVFCEINAENNGVVVSS